jgi:abequosyltransferase
LNHYLLTICIATYNRADFLAGTLCSILGQIDTYDDVEVLVVDGNSTDNTEVVVKALQSRCHNLRYQKLKEKGGVDKDYDIAVNSSLGIYCWLFTDDDLLKEDAVNQVRRAILRGAELIVVNSEICDYDIKRVLNKNALQMYSNVETDLSPLGRERFFKLCANYITFIGSIVIKKSSWTESPRDIFYGTRFIHVGVISALSDASRVLVMSAPVIKIRLGNAEWSSIAFKVWTQLWPNLIWSFTNLSVECKRSICLLEPWKNIKALFWYRALGAYSKTEYLQYIYTKPTSLYRSASLLIAYLPRSVIRFVFYVHAMLRSDKHRLYVLGDGGRSRNTWRSSG